MRDVPDLDLPVEVRSVGKIKHMLRAVAVEKTVGDGYDLWFLWNGASYKQTGAS